MSLKEIKEMINLMNENDLTELELERDGLKIRLRKGPAGITEQIIQTAALPQQAAAAKAAEEVSKAIEIKAPMVGTFYQAPSPDAEPYVEVGQTIEVGQVICIIEAMKLMNEIKAEVKGKIVEVLAENGTPVEFGQPLFRVEPV